MSTTTEHSSAVQAAIAASPASTLAREAIDINAFAKDAHGYYLVPPSIHLRAARLRGWPFAIRTASALIHYRSEWAAAMTAVYGTTGLHPSWADADGHPSAEALEKLPGLREAMEDAAQRWETYVDAAERRERTEGGGPYVRWWALNG